MKSLLSTLLLAILSSAQDSQDPNYYFHYNANTTIPPYNNSAFTSITPNATRDVSFNRAQTLTAGRNWTWTLSISDVPLPNTPNFTAALNNTPDAHAAYTAYSFTWPQDGNVNDAVNRTGLQCLYPIFATFPQNVSNAWDSSSHSCTSAIGIDCELYILNSIRYNPNRCLSSDIPSVYSAKECASSFGTVTTGGITTYGFELGDDRIPSNATAFEKGETLAWTLSDAYSPDNSTAFEIEENRLHIVIVSNGYGHRVLCNRIGEGLEIDGTEESGDGAVTGTTTSNETGEENGSARNGFGVAFVGAGVLAAVVFGSVL